MILRLALCLGLAATVGAEERKMVGVSGSKCEFPTASMETIAGKTVPLRLTGTALRTKAIFNVYSLASYVAEDATCKTPEDLAAADVPKRLDLVFEREVSGRDMAARSAPASRPTVPASSTRNSRLATSSWPSSRSKRA